VTISITGIGDTVSINGDTLDLGAQPETIDVTPINTTGEINGAAHNVEIQ
jgi:hypothetical protein